MKTNHQQFHTVLIAVTVLALLASVHSVRAQSGIWTEKAPMPTARRSFGVGVANGMLYAVGGVDTNLSILATMEAYDPMSNTWTNKPPMPTARGRLAVGVVNGILYAIGGCTGLGCWGNTIQTVQAYDPVSNTWTNKAPMPTARRNFAVGVVNGILYAVGGYDNSGLVTTVEAYDPVSDTWTTKAPMPTARNALAVGVVNGVLYAVGGDTESTSCATVEAYDPISNTWTTKAPMLTACSYLAAGVVNSILYAVGGSPGPTTLLAYNPLTDTWTTDAPMPTGRYDLGAGVVNGVLFAVGGVADSINGVTTNEAFAPFLLSVNVYAGLTLRGPVGGTFRIDCLNDLNNTNWTTLTNIVLPNSPYLFIDTSSPSFLRRFYRAVWLP